MKKIFHFIIVLLMVGVTTVNAQTKIKDGTVTGSSNLPNSNAILELESNNRGLLLPRIALTATTSPSPLSAHIKGVEVYNTAEVNDVDSGLYFNDGTKWVRVSNSADSATAWLLHGNTGTNAGTSLVGNAADGNYLGTTDAQNLVLATNGIKRAVIDTAGNVIGGFNSSVTPAVTNSFVWGAGNMDSANHSFVLGDTNTLSSLSNYSIVSGWGNTLTSGTSGTYDDQSSYSAVFGWQNSVSSYGSVVGGEANVLGKGSGAGTIVVGGANSIVTPQYVGWNQGDAAQNALFGFKNAIVTTNSTSSSHNNIVQGTLDTLSNASFSALFGALNTSYADRSIMTGTSNTASKDAFYSAVFGFENNDSANSTLISGQHNTLGLGANYSTVSGFGNTVNGPASLVSGVVNTDSASSSIIAGTQNIIGASASSSAAFGYNNKLGGNNSLVTGNQNISNGNNNLIYGQSNTMTDPGASLNFMGGIQNTIIGNASSNIVVGGNNTLTTSSTNFGTAGNIVFGSGNTARGWGNLIGGGINGGNTLVYGSQNCVLFGKNNVIGTSYSGENFVTGENDTTTGADWVMVAGYGLNSINDYETVVGKYNTPVTNALFTVGNGNSSSTQSNAITVIGTTAAPTATANNSTLNVNGSYSLAIRSVSGNTVLTNTDYKLLLRAPADSAFYTVGLPDPTTCKGRIYDIQSLAEGHTQLYLAFDKDAEDNYHVIPAGTSLCLICGNSGFTLQSDGSIWVITYYQG
jgi:hypothetical protein